MQITLLQNSGSINDQPFEIVERKGLGHPDTLCDRLAEHLSIVYSKYCLENFGIILRHQFDKLSLMGGKTNLGYGWGEIVSPVRLLLNGRVTKSFGGKSIDYQALLYPECAAFLNRELINFDFSKHARLIDEITSNSTRSLVDSSGAHPINYRFQPRTKDDLPESFRALSNDTAVGCGFYPFSILEQTILTIERQLSFQRLNKHFTWLGSDIKIMGARIKNKIDITLAVPQLSTEVFSKQDYQMNMQTITSFLADAVKPMDGMEISLAVNPSDDPDKDVVYLRYTGSCIESGDEGVVGRGNRLGGIISSCRPFSIEGLNGKNPAYHAGKLYSVAAWEISRLIWEQLSIPADVYIVSQIDRPLDDPWKMIVETKGDVESSAVQSIVGTILSDVSGLTQKLLSGAVPLC